MRLDPIEILGLAATVAGFFAYYTSTMIPLRIAAIISNLLYIPYWAYKGEFSYLCLHSLLMILNCYRLWEIKRLIAKVQEATTERFSLDWLKPFMKPKDFKAGEMIFRQGDNASDAFVIIAGEIGLPENGVTLGPGALLGEMGMFTQGNKRTTSAYCKSAVRTLRISYEEFQELYFQNPTFGLYLIRLIVQRMERNAEIRKNQEAVMGLAHGSNGS